MNSKRAYYLLLTVIALTFIALLGGAYEANILLTKKADSLTSLKAQSQGLAQKHVTLAQAKREIKQYAELEKITRAVVPEDKNQAAAVREIVNIAEANDVHLATISFPASTLGNTSSTPAAGGASATAKPSTANAASTKLSQLQPVKNIPGVYQLVITVQGDPTQPVPYNRFITFLSDLEHNRRTAQVSNIVITPDNQNRNNLSFSLSLNEYIKP